MRQASLSFDVKHVRSGQDTNLQKLLVKQVPGVGERYHDCAVHRHELSADATNSEKVHTLASIVLIQGGLEPSFATQAT